MAVQDIIQYSTTAGNNTTIDTSISTAENCPIANWNNAVRALMANVANRFGNTVSVVCSASSMAIGDQEEEYITITGATGPVTSLGTPTVANKFGYWLKFSSTPTITHNATSNILPTGADVTIEAGDWAYVRHEGSGNWRWMIWRASGVPLGAVTNLAAAAISGKTEITSIDQSNDFVLIWDATDSALKKAKPSNIYTSTALVKSTGQVITTSSTDVYAHGLSAAPSDFGAYFVMGASTELGYTEGDRVPVEYANDGGSSARAVSVKADATNITATWGSSAVFLLNTSTGSYAAIDYTKWTLVLWARP